MNHEIPTDPARRQALGQGLKAAGILVSILTIGVSRPAEAKMAKRDVQYQDHRHNGNGCGDCKFFSPASADGGAGACALVEGAVSRDGWCAMYTPRK